MRTQRETLVQVNVLRKWGPQARLNYQRQRGLVLGYRSPTGTVGKGRLLAAAPVTRSPLVRTSLFSPRDRCRFPLCSLCSSRRTHRRSPCRLSPPLCSAPSIFATLSSWPTSSGLRESGTREGGTRRGASRLPTVPPLDASCVVAWSVLGEIAFDPSGTPCASRAAGGRGVRHLGSIGAAVAKAQHAGPSGRAVPIDPTCRRTTRETVHRHPSPSQRGGQARRQATFNERYSALGQCIYYQRTL